MSLIQESHDSLPYIDQDITPDERARVESQIAGEVPKDYLTTLHPLLPASEEPKFSSLIQQELERQAAGQPLTGGIDLSRYEALDPPQTDPTSDEERPQVLEQWRDILRKSYSSSTHLQMRLTNLALLEKFGKNAWLIGNSQLEDVLRGLEKELAAVKEHTEQINRLRKGAQEGVRGEIQTLDMAWQAGVGKIIEVEVAAEGLRQEILELRRQGAR
ncbi:hypothetical protein L228DRAFT_270945 [Xylona heveae TC161]|uniref:BCAS2 family protein n=1 Tax=Xylona heveae (strain CBS 132557 / TC161) TaxID=1328760 RepID=A0A164ZWE1_XYLHT|nr:hypothetical protein L228DRAFT_270945 [Xylona heveae TC161]KZF19618.1 hypothetical protein L228DRAFT_270945 [Xylona heveae TC161]